MILTQEYLKWFLFVGIIPVAAFGVLFSSGQYSQTDIDFESIISAKMTNGMMYFVYSIYNTGQTNIDSVTAKVDCCGNVPSPARYPIIPGKSTGQISAMMQFNDTNYERGDTIHVTFTIIDTLGNTRKIIEPVRLD